MKIIGEDGCSVVVRFGFGGENSAEGGRCFLKRGTRFKKREGRMQARRGAPSGKGRGSRPDERQTTVRQTTYAPTSSTLMPARSPLIGLVKSAFTSNVRRSNCPVVFVAFQTE